MAELALRLDGSLAMTLWTREGKWIDGELFSNGKLVWKPSEAAKLPARNAQEATRQVLRKMMTIPSFEELEDLRAM